MENKVTKDELITKQQLEIEELKADKSQTKELVNDALNCLYHPEQWSTKCPDFPRVAMRGICQARDALRAI